MPSLHIGTTLRRPLQRQKTRLVSARPRSFDTFEGCLSNALHVGRSDCPHNAVIAKTLQTWSGSGPRATNVGGSVNPYHLMTYMKCAMNLHPLRLASASSRARLCGSLCVQDQRPSDCGAPASCPTIFIAHPTLLADASLGSHGEGSPQSRPCYWCNYCLGWKTTHEKRLQC